MKRNAIFVLFATLFVAQTLAAQPNAERSLIVGTWQLKQVLIDGRDFVEIMQLQAKARLEADESLPENQRQQVLQEMRTQFEQATQQLVSYRFIFNADSTGVTTTINNNVEFAWRLSENNTLIITSSSQSAAQETVIDKLTPTQLHISRTEDGQIMNMLFERVP